ncbi:MULTISPECIES: hypothetical protein [Enterobacter cloacae complex]|uniref:hypothetical protein n=1 Tax=Enterobacter cloacae complex TaxID=354276 RepID=UPI002074DE1C|nr:hypothetical protein [Enterobacter asburiae]MCM7695299.1 hypothetical protein [Enterobacter hormaechei]BEK74078.1 hypothetical protein EATA6166_19700 [Enterobacter asburiae]HEB5888580.1 hypothetical protein [Enterobacter asburiae]
MKFKELPIEVQNIAAELLAKKLDTELLWGAENKTVNASQMASTVRSAFESLFAAESGASGSGIGIKE